MQRHAQFPMGLASAAQARAFVRSELEGWGLDGVIDDALLVVTELVVNATLHAQSATEVSVERVDGGVRIEVRDHSAAMPSRRDFGLDAVTGRGLHILDALAPGWQVVPEEHGKVVVAEVAPARRPAGRVSPMADTAREALVQVELRGVPVEMLLRSRQHSDALVRELVLMSSIGDGSAGAEASRRVHELFAEFGAAHRPFVELAQSKLDEAVHSGAATVDISYQVPPETRASALALLDLLAEIDELCRRGALLTLVTPDDVVAFRRWYLLQFVAQIDGDPPTPCT